MRAKPGKEIIGQRVNDPPLRGIGILRLVHQNMVEAAVELIADPLGHFGAAKQRGGAADLIVEVDQPLARLGLVPCQRIGPAKLQRRGQPCRQREQVSLFPNGSDRRLHPGTIFGIIGQHLGQRRQIGGFIVQRKNVPVEIIQSRQPRRFVRRQPIANSVGLFFRRGGEITLLVRPALRRRQQHAQGSDIEGIIAAQGGHAGLIHIAGQPQQALDPHVQRRLPPARPEPKLARLRALQEVFLGRLRAQPQGQNRQRIQYRCVAAHLSILKQIAQHLPCQQAGLMILHRPSPGG